MSTVIGVDHPLAHNEDFLAWLREHDVEPNHTYKLEVGEGEMTVYQFALKDGRHYVDDSGEVAYREPFTVKFDRAWGE